ncbi:DUF3972 domain-containing protein [Hydrogenimonas cancrithermarum]|uniref:DUF3972 domain-containing protein n=1 Tax=Hydrogenimonas cancrithermarum TaxID=2993563 RepID=A0ABN6WW65_9BACT|nr:DUF3972 domain-containing protein [Hydrogenimonas cancrithermarum]BDY13126.1 hypothetical protein HCR_14380 [Hydrogenimonas cancrithermarum]
MQQLVKPSEYAKMHGLSRQSVYAKIKRGTLPSRKIDGRYYVIVASDIEQDVDKPGQEEKIEHVSLIDEYREILKAKDETIEVLKASIEDLKEANAQITQTLQQEITLLKQAFHEMKTIYQNNYQLTHVKPNEDEEKRPHIDVEPEEEAKPEKAKKSEKNTKEKRNEQKSEDECWIPLGDLIQRQQYNYNKAKQVVKRFKKAYKKGDKRIKKQNGIYYISCYDFYEDILE